MENISLRVWIEGTIVAALAIVLSFIPTNIGTGFTISLGMIPLVLYSLRRGTIAGLAAGFLWGILHYLIGNVAILSLIQGFIEYFIAFMFAGMAGLFSNSVHLAIKNKKPIKLMYYIVIGAITGTIARFFWHFIAGYYFWGSYAPEGMSAVWYSFIANGSSALATIIVTAIVLVLLSKTNPYLFIPIDKK
ncbi:energy-coupled thiamine transporter ThiT [Carnobacterium funditum]|uniref:energy-coupled thiamine transporter ThiT n=1 Tax=Carnobacterium funditum TaxID=2752 RepID=UPI00054D8407|nr:energy-coupled thiamine transporter ThiT [Carnobacterium funditum]